MQAEGPYPSGGEAPSAEAYIPTRTVSLAVLSRAVQDCRGCGIYRCGTRAVFGEGFAGPGGLMFVGEQPGDSEEKAGHPFVGPAGGVLDRALEAAGIDRAQTYVTNAVKHFKFEPRGERRIHSKPSSRETQACRPWLQREIAIVRPAALVTLGATASQSLMGPAFRVTIDGSRIIRDSMWAPVLLATTHPSAILRMLTSEQRHEAMYVLIRDLQKVARAMARDARKSA